MFHCENCTYRHHLINENTIPEHHLNFFFPFIMEVTELPELWTTNSSLLVNEFYDDVNVSSTPLAPEVYFRDMSRFLVKRVLLPIIMCVGVLGNGITIVILTRRRMRSSTNHYLTALAISDLFYLVFAFTLNLDHYKAFQTYYYFSYYRFALMLADACSNTSVWLTVTFTIERYVAVCHPIRGKVLCTRSRAKKVIVCVVCLCFAVVIPTPFEWTIVEVVSIDSFNQTFSSFQLGTSSLGLDETYRKIYYWFTSITFVLLPLTLLAIFNSFLIRSVHHSKTQRRRMTMRGPKKLDNAHQENRITIMLIAVVIMFLLCQLPTAVYLVYTSFYTAVAGSNEEALFRGLGNLFNCLVAINAACNFILYCAFSDRYRRTFLRTFMPCLFRLGSPNHSQTNFTTAFSNACQASEMDSSASKKRLSAEKSRQNRRNLNKNKLNSDNTNGHFNCHPETETDGKSVKLDQNNSNRGDENNSTLVTERNGHNLLITPKWLDNGHLAINEDNVSDTTQETIVSITDAEFMQTNNPRKRQLGINTGTSETVNL